ncbi:hypothetical protein F5Y15DRAFT_363776 [Xylariaceae sp. FL0016]|nr:hypothetical protein F5Y15DRAFT_363776 [Xylariaceae sp. FL0016]
MPAATPRRKAQAKTKAITTTQKSTSASIGSFARVSKTVTNPNIKEGLRTSSPPKYTKLETITPASRKRKVAPSTEDEDAEISAEETHTKSSIRSKKSPSAPVAAPTTSVTRSQGRPNKKARPEPASPAPRKRGRSPSASDSDESTINAGTLFKKLRLESSPSRSSSPFTTNTSVCSSDVEIDPKPTADPNQLPSELISLVSLHAAFLKTLTLHYAHNGTNVPADLRVLCPNIARAWGKRRVTDAEIRTCIGILGSSAIPSSSSRSENPFLLSNFGRGKICIELNGAHAGPLREDKLNDLFRSNLEALWLRFVADAKPNDVTMSLTFMTALPKAPVTLCESVTRAAPVMLRGQQRLEALKRGIAAQQQEKEVASSSTKQQADTPMINADGTKMSLLDRIRMKSLQKASLPAGLTPAQLERRAALQRIEEVASMIGMLSRASAQGQGRISFTMQAMLEKLKDSFRMGISREEGAACVRLLGNEVAPEWVRVVKIGGRENVVVETDAMLSKGEIGKRVQAIVAKE